MIPPQHGFPNTVLSNPPECSNRLRVSDKREAGGLTADAPKEVLVYVVVREDSVTTLLLVCTGASTTASAKETLH